MGEGEVGFAGDDVVGEVADFLFGGFVADFGSAEDDDGLGAETFEVGDELGGGGDVPDVDADSDDFWILREDGFEDVDGALVDVEFEDGGTGGEGAEVGQEIAQTEGGMSVAGVEGGQ